MCKESDDALPSAAAGEHSAVEGLGQAGHAHAPPPPLQWTQCCVAATFEVAARDARGNVACWGGGDVTVRALGLDAARFLASEFLFAVQQQKTPLHVQPHHQKAIADRTSTPATATTGMAHGRAKNSRMALLMELPMLASLSTAGARLYVTEKLLMMQDFPLLL